MGQVDGGVVAPAEADVLERAEVVLVSYKSAGHVAALLELWPASLRVALVDNARGADGLADFAAPRDNVRYLDGGGQGFGRAANLGALSSSAEVVVFVNPDSRPTTEALRSLVSGLLGDPGAASHAATVTGADDEIEIGVGGWEPTVVRTAAYAVGLHKLAPASGVYAKPAHGERIDVDWTTGACMAVRSDAFRRLGGFDESFFVYCEDMSFGRRAGLAGLRQVLRHDVVVAHGAAGSGAPSTEMLRLRGASFANYVERYHPGLPAVLMRAAMTAGYVGRAGLKTVTGDPETAALHRGMVVGLATRRAFVAGEEVARARFEETAAPARPTGDPARTLLVTKEFGVPATSGGMLRTLAMAQWLAGRGPVVVVHPDGVSGVRLDAAGETVVERLRAASDRHRLADLSTAWVYRSIGAPRTAGAGLLTNLEETLDRLGPFDAAIVDHTCLFALADRLPVDLPVVLSTHNVESDLMAQRAAASTGWERPAAALESRLLRRLETGVGSRHATVVCTQADADAVGRDGGLAEVVVARNGVTAPTGPGRAEAAERGAIDVNELLFTGALDWRPNINGILWLLRSPAWARLVAERPGLTLTVAGRNPSEEFRREVEAAPGARVEANVPSMRPLLERARLGVAPLLEGGGSRIKLLEYVGYALPSVSTYVGASGLDDLPERAIIQTPEDPEAFCEAIRLALDEGSAVLPAETVDAMLAVYGWDRALAPIARLLEDG